MTAIRYAITPTSLERRHVVNPDDETHTLEGHTVRMIIPDKLDPWSLLARLPTCGTCERMAKGRGMLS
ncbi:hypothetical protein AB0395_34840 [Streptosporangium sp. NPDC051023]|uniref:hypothetical protein n=1 Tax=Streptosporangium sp. NPDC051023 TaxID=3155410 RepID=UPI00344CEDBA